MPAKAKTTKSAKAKSKTLPKDFEKRLEGGVAIDELKVVFERCEVDAREGRSSKRTALMMPACPDELSRWLVARGADLRAVDQWGRTPLDARAGSRRQPSGVRTLIQLGAPVNPETGRGNSSTPLHAAVEVKNVENVKALVAFGAKVDALDDEGLTPLELGLRGCTNADLVNMAAVAKLILASGAKKKPTMKPFVKRLGETFEFHRDGFNKDYVEATSAALAELYALFDVAPVPRRKQHDGHSPIVVSATTWQRRHGELWDLLVPARGPAATVQGEVIRISGRIGSEIHRNGGANWDRDYTTMAKAFLVHVQTMEPLPSSAFKACQDAVATLLARQDGDTAPIAKHAVEWVLLNPRPVPLGKVKYGR